ncbi:MAG: zf-HC2 domain-containing protein [Phycisphaerales bacterium]|nr:MAG: zf-HC2 domain-containing protein [Phycisphaerales bacterium]
MKNDNTKQVDCQTVREELPTLLYDELDGESRQLIEQHVEACQQCRDELEGFRRTLRLLDSWSVEAPETAEPFKTHSSVESRLPIRLRPVLVGAAAAVIVFAILGWVGTDWQYADGQLVVTLGRGSMSASYLGQDLNTAVPMLRAVAREEADIRCNSLLTVIQENLVEFERQQEERRLALVGAVDVRRDEDWRHQMVMFQALAGGLEREVRYTNRALDDLWTHLSQENPAISRKNELN